MARRGKPWKESGVALVLVLWALVFLTVLATNFASNMKVQSRLTRNTIDQSQAYYAARAGLEIGVARILQRQDYVKRHKSRNPDRAEEDDNIEYNDNIESITIWKMDGSPNEATFDNGKILVYITRESSKIDINKSSPNVLKNLFKEWNIPEEEINTLTDSIADWKDGDTLHRTNGAEDDYYQKLDPPYHAKNADFTSVEELLRVRGFTREILFMPKQADEEDDTDDDQKTVGTDADESSTIRLIDCLTVHNPSGRIDVRYASRPVLESVPFITPGLANRIIELRDEIASENITMNQIKDSLGDDIYTGVQGYINVGDNSQENRLSILSEARMENGFITKIKVLADIKSSGTNQVTFLQWIDWVS